MKHLLYPIAIIAACIALPAEAALITTVDFSDGGTWSTTLSNSGSATNESQVVGGVGGSIVADKSGSAGGVRIEVDLVGSISTAGFENITLGFEGFSVGGLEWNGNLNGGVASSDGLRIVGSGVEINANSLNDISGTAAEVDFDAGEVFPTANFNSDFSFDASANNGSITDLTFTLQVNSNDEIFTLSDVRIYGDSVAAIPEPSSVLLLSVASIAGIVVLRRRRTKAEIDAA